MVTTPTYPHPVDVKALTQELEHLRAERVDVEALHRALTMTGAEVERLRTIIEDFPRTISDLEQSQEHARHLASTLGQVRAQRDQMQAELETCRRVGQECLDKLLSAGARITTISQAVAGRGAHLPAMPAVPSPGDRARWLGGITRRSDAERIARLDAADRHAIQILTEGCRDALTRADHLESIFVQLEAL